MIKHNIRDKSGRFAPKKGKTTKKPKTTTVLNVFMLDDTGSMWPKKEATVEGFNSVLQEAKKPVKNVVNVEAFGTFGVPGKATYTFGEVKPLSYYSPNQGSTAIYEMVVATIPKIETSLAALPKGTKVVFTIFTDGENNDAYHYQAAAKELITKKQKEGWVINFMGAGDKLFVEQMAQNIGIFLSNTLNYANTSQGTKEAMRGFAGASASYKTSVSKGEDSNIGFFSEE